MTDQPTTSQEQPARLTKQREQEIRETYALHLAGDVMAIRNLLDELDAVRAEVQAAEARAERVRTALREIDSLSSSGFCAVGKESKQHYIMLMGNAAMDALREAFADPSPPASAEFPAHVYAIEVDGRRFADADAVKAYLLSDDTEPPADEQTPPARRTVAPRFRHLIEPRQTPLGPEPRNEMPLEEDVPTAGEQATHYCDMAMAMCRVDPPWTCECGCRPCYESFDRAATQRDAGPARAARSGGEDDD